jgi:hypothetical protein
MKNRFFTSLRFVQNDSYIGIWGELIGGLLAAKLPTNPHLLQYLQKHCHPERSEGSYLFLRTIMLFNILKLLKK